jgi:transcriptional regulator with XRE-family HTH domain
MLDNADIIKSSLLEKGGSLTLKQLRLKSGLSQPQLAMMAGVSTSTIWRAERGQSIAKLNQHRIAQVLGVNPSEIEEFNEEESNDNRN